MFVIERFAGVFLYSFVLVVICYSICCEKRKRYTHYFFIYCGILSIMAYFFIPIVESDIYRWANIFKEWRLFTFQKIYMYATESSYTPLSYIYMYTLNRIGGYRLLMAVTALIVYGCIFYIMKDYAKKNEINRYVLALTLLFYMSSGIFIDVISDVRYMMAFAILAVCFYREIFYNQKTIVSIFFYLVAALLHVSAWAIIIIRFIALFVNKGLSIKKRVLSLGCLAIFSILFFGRIATYLSNMFEKLNSYLLRPHYSYFWEYLIGGIVLCYLIVVFRKSIRFKYGKKEYLEVLKVFIIFNIFSIVEFNMFHRMVALNSILFIPIIEEYLNNSNTKIRKQNLLLISFVVLLIACTRGHLCSYKFFVL